MGFHPALSLSPLEKAFCYVASHQLSPSFSGPRGGLSDEDDDVEYDLPPYFLSPPEASLLRSAEENPLEYTLADTDDAVSYVRILLKMLDQVTNKSNTSSSYTNTNNNTFTTKLSPTTNSPSQSHNTSLRSSGSEDERILTLGMPAFSEEEAHEMYYQSSTQCKRLVVAHYCVAKIYETICVSLDCDEGRIPSVAKLFHGREDGKAVEAHDGLQTIHLEKDDWRPLLTTLHNRGSDEYTKRGAALILAYILNTGCEATKKKPVLSKPAPRLDEDLLDLFSDEHKTSLNPASPSTNVPVAESSIIEDTLQSFISWLTFRLQYSGANASLGVVAPALGVLLSSNKQARAAFVQAGGIGYISRHLRAKRQRPLPPPSPQFHPLRSRQNSGGSKSSTQQEQQVSSPDRRRSSNPSIRSRSSTSSAGSTSSSSRPYTRPGKASYVANGFNSVSPSNSYGISPSSGFGAAVSANLKLPELNKIKQKLPSKLPSREEIIQKLPTTEDVETGMDAIISTASEAAATVRSETERFASLAASQIAASSLPLEASSPPPKISASASVQQFYDLAFCLWCLTLDCATDESMRKHFARDGAVPALAHLLKKVPREKVLRMTLACLRSLLALDTTTTDAGTSAGATKMIGSQQQQPFVHDMIGCGVLKSLKMVKLRRWNDVDLEEDLDFLNEFLANRAEELTQWSAYEAQMSTGILRWDEMLHTHHFFRANAKHMEGPKADFAPLKRLVDILYSNTTSGKLRKSGRGDEISYVGLKEVNGWDQEDLRDDEICETLAVCLFDIGEFARNYPNGKSVLGSRCGIGAKSLIMQYVHHPRDNVREQALLCASKMLVRNWRAIDNTSASK